MIWKEKYKIGITVIDEQHEELFRRVSEFVQAIRTEGLWADKEEKVKVTMAFLQQYVITHFNYEEAYQKKLGYPDRMEHHKIHEEFKAEVAQYAKQFSEEGYCEPAVQKLAGKLLAWLINHVVATDQRMANYVIEQGLEHR